MVFYGWWMILAMDIIGMIQQGSWAWGIGLFIIPLTQEFGWTRTEISLGISLSKFESGVDGPIVGWMADHFGSRWAAIVCLATASVLLISLSFINSLLSFYVLMIIIFVLPTNPYVAMMTAIARWFKRKAGKAMGFYSAGFGLCGLISQVISWLIINYGWRAAFIGAGIIILVICIPLSFVIKNYGPEHYGLLPDGEAPEGKSDPQRSTKSPDPTQKETLRGEGKDFTLREALKDKSFWLIGVAYAFSNLAFQAINVHLVPHLINIGFEPELAALGIPVVVLSSSVGRLGFGWLGDFIKKRYLLALGFTIMLVSCLVLLSTSVPWVVFLALAVFGPGMGGTISTKSTIQREYYGRENYGKIEGTSMLISSGPTYFGPVFAGWMFDIYGSYVPAFTLLYRCGSLR